MENSENNIENADYWTRFSYFFIMICFIYGSIYLFLCFVKNKWIVIDFEETWVRVVLIITIIGLFVCSPNDNDLEDTTN